MFRPTAVSESLRGSLDGLTSQLALGGWAWQPGRDDRPIVEVLADNILIGRIRAGLFRSDLAAAGIGDGHHGFEIAVPDEWLDGASHMFTLRLDDTTRAVIAERPILMPRRPRSGASDLNSAAAILRRVQLHTGEVAPTPASIADAATRLSARFGDGIAVAVLHLYLLDRPAGSREMDEALRQLAAYTQHFGDLVDRILGSEEMAQRAAPLPPLSTLTCWLDIEPA